jgi:WD40 repeat protein
MTLPESTGVSFSAAMTFSNDAALLAVGDFPVGARVRIWDLRKPDARPVVLTEPFVGSIRFAGSIRSLTFSRDTSRLAAKSDPNTVRVWDLSNPAAAPIVLQARARTDSSDSPINHRPVVFSPDGKRVASADVDAIRIWDLADPATPLLLRGSEGNAVALAFALDGPHLTAAMRDNKIQTWDLLKPDAAPVLLLQAPAGKVSSGAFSEDLSRVAVAADKTLRIWDLDDPRAAPIVVECPLEVRFVEITSNRSVFSLGGAARRLDLNDPGPARARHIKANQSEVSRLKWPVFSPSLNYMAASIERTLRVWDLRNAESDPVFAAEGPGVVTSLTFSPDGQRVASGASDKTVHVWNLLNVKDTQVLSQGHDGPVLSLGFSTDGERLGSVSVASSIRILIWKWRHFSEKPARIEFPLPTGENCDLSIKLSPDLNYLACGGLLDFRILIWDLRTPARPPVSLSMPGLAPVVSLAFSADSNHLASGGTILISMWDLRNTTAQPKVFLGGAVSYAVAFSPDGQRITDGFRIWDVRNPAVPPEVLNQDLIDISSLRFSKDGLRLAAFVGTDGRLQILDVWSGLADYLCTRVVRNMSLSEWSHYVGTGIPYERTCPKLPPGEGIRN